MRFTITAAAALAFVAPAVAQNLDDLGIPECLQSCVSDNISISDFDCDISDLQSQDSATDCLCGVVENNDDLKSCMSDCSDDDSSSAISELENQCDGLSIQNDGEDAAVTRAAPAFLAAGGLVAAFFL